MRPTHVRNVEQLVIDALAELGVPTPDGCAEYPGVWVDADGPDPRKICAIGVRLKHGAARCTASPSTWRPT